MLGNWHSYRDPLEDERAITVADEDSEEEYRFITLCEGPSPDVLVVVHTEEIDELITIIRSEWRSQLSCNSIVKEYKMAIDFSDGKRGPVVPPDPNKTCITIRLDTDIIDHFKGIVNGSSGGNY